VLNKNPYEKTKFYDEIIDDTLPENDPNRVIEEGTPLMAAFLNNNEEGTWLAHELINKQASLIRKMQVQMEIDGRVPGNSGSFFDTFAEEPIRMVRQAAKAVLTASRAAGTTVLNVDETEGFTALTEVTIYDGTNSEDTLITDVTASTITVQPLVNSYVKGAVVARGNTKIDIDKMTIGSWGTYAVTVGEVV